MPERPTLHAGGLIFRAGTPDDADEIALLANDPLVSQNLLTMPFPYTRDDAVKWLEMTRADHDAGKSTGFLITRPHPDASAKPEIVGAVGIRLEPAHRRGEMGYWLGRKFWGQGYATIAARTLITHIFATTDLHRIYANHFIGNEVSGRVMEKVGMKREGVLRGGTCKQGVNRDVVLYAIVRGDPIL